MKRFIVGDLARVKYIRNGKSSYWYPGAIVEIARVCNNTIDKCDHEPIDYEVRTFNGEMAYPIDEQLEPLDANTELDKLFKEKEDERYVELT